ncbi:MAG: hypothetical protein RLZZ272_1426 [Actinomycetota bacterium]|jgi:hypothetical protein
MTEVVIVTHVTAIAVLVGIIWTVQLVHYPMLAAVAPERFAAAHADHSRAITAVVALPWALEGVTTLWLVVAPPVGVPRWLVGLGALAAAVPVVVTLVASVPAHARLSAGFDLGVHARLVATNRWRTLGWTAHGAIAIAILARSSG